MRDLSKLLWCDLKNDEERIEFLLSGRAYDTGIISPDMIPVVVDLLKYRQNTKNMVIEDIKSIANSLWDGITDTLTEGQITRIEKLYSNELKVLGIL